MKRFEKIIGAEKSRKGSVLDKIRERIKTLLSNSENISVEDRYELESCRTLTYENVVTWLLANKPLNFDGALLYRFKSENNKVFPFIFAIVYISNDMPLMGRDYSKKLIYCTSMDAELDNLFNGKESVIVK